MNHLLVQHYFLSLLFLYIYPLTVYGGDVAINWSIKTYEPESVQVGDTVTFAFNSNHNVFIHPSGNCDETGRVDFGGTSSPASYTFAEEDIGEMIFACDIGSHCESGQIVTFNVIAGGGEDTPTRTPTETSAGATMKKTLGFSWTISMFLLHLW